MSELHLGIQTWLQTPPGRYALTWEQLQLDSVVADIFGYHALQLGLPALDALAANRMPHRWRAGLVAPAPAEVASTPASAADAPPADPPADFPADPRIALVTAADALPFPEASLDLIVLPHTLDHGPAPKAVLGEVQRVLVHEGRVVITGVNPASLWGLTGALPEGKGNPVTPRRLRALLQNTDLELETLRHGGYGAAPRDADAQPGVINRQEARLWPARGALWCATAVKRSRGAILVGPAWKNQLAAAGAQAGVAQRTETADSAIRPTPANITPCVAPSGDR